MKAIGVYIRTLRDAHGLTQLQVANAAGTTSMYVYRIESGLMESPGTDLLFKVAEAVKGRGDHIMRLFLKADATDEEALALAAEAQLTPEERDELRLIFASDEETRKLLEEVYQASHNPTFRARLRGYLDSMLGGGGEPAAKPPRTSTRRRRG